MKGGKAPRYAAPPGLLLYVHLGELFAVPSRPSQTDLGRAVPVAMSERTSDTGGNEGSGNYAISGNGTLAYIAGGRARNSTRLVWIDRAGKLDLAPLPERDYENATVSPDGARAIVQIREATTVLWVYDLTRNTLTPIGNSAGSSQSPVWTADGARVIYRGTRKVFAIYWRPVDGSGSEERLTTKPDVSQTPTSASPDGHWLGSTRTAQGSPAVSGSGSWASTAIAPRITSSRRRPASPTASSRPTASGSRIRPPSRRAKRSTWRRFPARVRDARSRPMAAPSRSGPAMDPSCSSRTAQD